jgi:hypothetical protein
MSEELPEGYSFVPPESGWFGYTTDTDLIEKRYRLSPDAYHAMLSEQDGRCAICRRDPVSVGPLCVDHDHDHPEKVVRGLLCDSCNLGLGKFKDDPHLLVDASKYLFARGCATTRRIDEYVREQAHPETIEPTHSLELHYLGGAVRVGASLARNISIGDDGRFVLNGREWRVVKRSPLPPSSGPGAEQLICEEVGE